MSSRAKRSSKTKRTSKVAQLTKKPIETYEQPTETPLWLGLPRHPLCRVLDSDGILSTQTKILKHITKEKTEVKESTSFMIIGPPGAGKSTIISEFIANQFVDIGSNFVSLDFDTFVQFHPDYKGAEFYTDVVSGESTKYRIADRFRNCSEQIEELGDILLNGMILRTRYNIVVYSHRWEDAFRTAFTFTYTPRKRFIIIFVYADLEVLLARTRRRALVDGKFMASSLESQDEFVIQANLSYINMFNIYRKFAHEFYFINNTEEKYKWVKLPDVEINEVSDTDAEMIKSIGVDVQKITPHALSEKDIATLEKISHS
jgi:hypothetical protein